jgi:hypothetical protein
VPRRSTRVTEVYLALEDANGGHVKAPLRSTGGQTVKPKGPENPHEQRLEGDERTRTAVRGFAGLCLTTRPRRQRRSIVAGPYPKHPHGRCDWDNRHEGGSMYIGGGLLALILIIILLILLF